MIYYYLSIFKIYVNFYLFSLFMLIWKLWLIKELTFKINPSFVIHLIQHSFREETNICTDLILLKVHTYLQLRKFNLNNGTLKH